MKLTLRLATVGAALVLGTALAPTVEAQATRTPDRQARREQLQNRRDVRGDRAKRIRRNGSPEQKAWLQSYSAERKRLREAVKAGTLDKKAAGEQLRAWRKAHQPPKSQKPATTTP